MGVSEQLKDSSLFLHLSVVHLDIYSTKPHEEMTSRKSNPSDVIVHHHDEICDLLSTTNTALRSLAAKLFGEHIIDRRTKNEVTRKASYKSVDTLLDYLELKIDGNPGLLKKVFDVMEELDALTDVVEKMRTEKAAIQEERQGMPVLTGR